MNEQLEQNGIVAPDLESYIHHKSFSRILVLSIIGLTCLAALFWIVGMFNQPILSDDAYKRQFSFHNIDSLWVEKSTVERPDFKGILLVPQIRFQVKNESQQELRSVQMIGVFRFLNSGRSIGESIAYLFRDSAKPGDSSQVMVMQTENGYEAKTIQDFEKNRKFWEGAMVELYAKSGRQKLTFIKSFYISRRIKGLNLDVQLSLPEAQKAPASPSPVQGEAKKK